MKNDQSIKRLPHSLTRANPKLALAKNCGIVVGKRMYTPDFDIQMKLTCSIGETDLERFAVT